MKPSKLVHNNKINRTHRFYTYSYHIYIELWFKIMYIVKSNTYALTGGVMVRLATCRRDPLLFNYYCTRVRGIFYCSLSFLAGENQVFVMVHSGLDSQ